MYDKREGGEIITFYKFLQIIQKKNLVMREDLTKFKPSSTSISRIRKSVIINQFRCSLELTFLPFLSSFIFPFTAFSFIFFLSLSFLLYFSFSIHLFSFSLLPFSVYLQLSLFTLILFQFHSSVSSELALLVGLVQSLSAHKTAGLLIATATIYIYIYIYIYIVNRIF